MYGSEERRETSDRKWQQYHITNVTANLEEGKSVEIPIQGCRMSNHSQATDSDENTVRLVKVQDRGSKPHCV